MTTRWLSAAQAAPEDVALVPVRLEKEREPDRVSVGGD